MLTIVPRIVQITSPEWYKVQPIWVPGGVSAEAANSAEGLPQSDARGVRICLID